MTQAVFSSDWNRTSPLSQSAPTPSADVRNPPKILNLSLPITATSADEARITAFRINEQLFNDL